MSDLDLVRDNFNDRSREWLRQRFSELGWNSDDIQRKFKGHCSSRTITRILEKETRTPQITTFKIIVEVLAQPQNRVPDQLPESAESLAQKWLRYTISQEGDEAAPGTSPRTTLWVLGSYKGVSGQEKEVAQRIVQSLPQRLIHAGIRVVTGDSTMLREFMHSCRDSHNLTKTITPNPVMIFGRLRKRDMRDLFMDAINCVPDLALLLGGDTEKGRVREEYEGAVAAGIPIICIPSTGGEAKRSSSVADKAKHLTRNLNQTGKEIDTGDLITAIWESISFYEKY